MFLAVYVRKIRKSLICSIDDTEPDAYYAPQYHRSPLLPGAISEVRQGGRATNEREHAKMVEDARRTLYYPKHVFSPEDLITFVECEGFLDDSSALGLNDDHMESLQYALMGDPYLGSEIPGAGGLREDEILVADRDPPIIIQLRYVYFEEFKILLLVLAYPGSPSELSSEGRSEARDMVARQRAEFENRFKR